MKTGLLIISLVVLHVISFAQAGSELTFVNPVHVGGTPLRQGASYRFYNVKTGVDAIVFLKRFSRNDIHMATIDNSVFGWDKAFQPEFGLPGTVAPFQNWFIDFEVTFYEAGTNTRKRLDTVDFTALDVDGDNVSISEYVVYDRPNSIVFATSTALTTSPEGLIGSNATCFIDSISTPIITCNHCGGSGVIGDIEDSHCDGSGKLHSGCLHPYQGISGTNVNGPVTNFTNIDTSSTLVMSVYRYLNRDRINFRYGARSGAASSTAGIRLNSMWFRRFNLNLLSILPVHLSTFSVSLRNSNVNMQWNTGSDLDINQFIIERSVDGKNFTERGVVLAKNEAVHIGNYEFNDIITSNLPPIIYYRLRMEGNKGEITYSDIRLIRTAKNEPDNVQIVAYPNPVTNELKITIPPDWQNKNVVFDVYNASGQMAIHNQYVNAGQTTTLNLQALSPGTYIIAVSHNGKKSTQRIIKQ